ncbi:DNA (cytosine-5-)-methyltransferase [Streptomyces sp. NPDC020141]|uniref:DNA (cytosine-5-)-methyltransferase n=1 Tax=Streptomyces sp. NPDC020141 TaxID=3365065 RepID=UPI00379F48D0
MTALARLFPRDRAEKLFKTPTANLASNGSAQHPDKRKAGGHGPTLEDEVVFLLHVDPDDEQPDDGPHSPREWWGEFAPAVYRWETIRGTAAPVPLVRGPRGGLKLAPRFAEWMMGLESGWVTDVPGLSHSEQIGRIGNGVVPHQAYAAFRLLMTHHEITEESTHGTLTHH